MKISDLSFNQVLSTAKTTNWWTSKPVSLPDGTIVNHDDFWGYYEKWRIENKAELGKREIPDIFPYDAKGWLR